MLHKTFPNKQIDQSSITNRKSGKEKFFFFPQYKYCSNKNKTYENYPIRKLIT